MQVVAVHPALCTLVKVTGETSLTLFTANFNSLSVSSSVLPAPMLNYLQSRVSEVMAADPDLAASPNAFAGFLRSLISVRQCEAGTSLANPGHIFVSIDPSICPDFNRYAQGTSAGGGTNPYGGVSTSVSYDSGSGTATMTVQAGTPASCPTSWAPGPTVPWSSFNPSYQLLQDGRLLVFFGTAPSFGSGTPRSFVVSADGSTITNGGNLATSRIGTPDSSGCVLGDGRVLIAGGQVTEPNVNTSQTFDPVGLTWTAQGTLPTALGGQSSLVTLASGDGLMVGGILQTGNVPQTTVSLFSKAGNTWSSVAPLNHPTALAASILLNNGKVLVIGGTNVGGRDNTPSAICELYDPVANSWTDTGSLNHARTDGYFGGAGKLSAFLLASGNVLVVGGTDGGFTYIPQIELYNVLAGTWSVVATTTILDAQLVLLANGKMAFINGLDALSNPIPSTTYFDTVAFTFGAAQSDVNPNPGTDSFPAFFTGTACRYFILATNPSNTNLDLSMVSS